MRARIEVPHSTAIHGRGRFWDGWLMAGFAGATAGGLLLVAAPDFLGLQSLDEVVRDRFLGGTWAPGAEKMRAWLYAVEGSTMAAFGILGFLVARTAFRRRERWARNALA